MCYNTLKIINWRFAELAPAEKTLGLLDLLNNILLDE